MRLLPCVQAWFKRINMLPQNLNWISLIILLCRQGVDTKRYFSCEGGSVPLSCDWGYIKVITANYGRTDHTTCSTGRSLHQLSNVDCFQETSVHVMSKRCDGRKSCSVPAVNSVFYDPCVGTYKYLDVSYLCLPFSNGVIWIHHANYGRRDLVTCPHKLATSPDCYSPQTRSLRSSCNGKNYCQLNASKTSLLSDPCPDVHKYLEVMYSCI
ncbi:L-rhamnose-binding lectin CSL3-like [Carassius gibelio]|uniref:L-rhamnose-binding lectin CSL3-like n=1 Tax=Carassius gibelio TaxID=101364 RepID=UPI0022782C5A|nr:L-rhamnose-binding lectin CSL3-like [Carassius gibelio]